MRFGAQPLVHAAYKSENGLLYETRELAEAAELRRACYQLQDLDLSQVLALARPDHSSLTADAVLYLAEVIKRARMNAEVAS